MRLDSKILFTSTIKVSRKHKFLVSLFFVLLLNACSGDKPNDPKLAADSAPKQISRKTTGLTYEDRKTWRAILKWPDSCEAAFDSREGTWSGLTFHPVGPKQYLVEVQCFLAAYQPTNMYVWYDEGTNPSQAKLLTLKIASSEDGKKIVWDQVTELAGLSDFNAEKKELSVTSKYRGVGDCGSFALYEIQNGAATLKEFRGKFQCDGKWQEPKTYERVSPQ